MDKATQGKGKRPAKKLHLFQHATGVRLASIPPKDLNGWCDANGYLPHGPVPGLKGYGYVVIAK